MTAAILALVAALTALAHPGSPDALSDLPRGEPPAVGYVDHGVWRGPDGRTVDVPDRHGISSITPYDGGFLIADTRWFEGSNWVVRVNETGHVDERGPWASSGGAVVADNGSVAWTSFAPLESGLETPSLVHVVRGGCVSTYDWPGRAPFGVAGFAGERIVVNGAFELPTVLVSPSGERTTLSNMTHASDVSGSLVAGSIDPDGYGGVVEAKTGDVLWQTRTGGLTFSPSGRRVAGIDRGTLIVFRSSDGSALWRIDLPVRFFVGPPVWEDERHLLAVANRRRETAILRFGRGGEVERTTAVERHDRFGTPYVLGTQP